MLRVFFLFGRIIDGDCSGLVPPCWQEIHYLFAGMMLGVLLAFPFYHLLHLHFTATHD